MRELQGMSESNPNNCEEIIRDLFDQIKNLKESEEKDQLAYKLRSVACQGLHKDLKQLLEDKNLKQEGLNLVRKYMTDVPTLATHLYKNASNPVALAEDGLVNVSKRLGPALEVFGGLNDNRIDISKEWVKKLCEKASSLQALGRLTLDDLEECCKGADKGEMEAVYSLVEKAELHRNLLAAVPQDKNLAQQINITRAQDKKKLENAKELIEEVKNLVADEQRVSGRDVHKKLEELIEKLKLPPTWKEKKNDELIEKLDEVIKQFIGVVDSDESYKSEVEIITKSSAGRALCGIYHSLHEPSKPAGRPLLLVPTHANLSNPNSGSEKEYLTFASKQAARKYVDHVKTLSVNLGLGITGFQGLITGGLAGGRDQIHAYDQTVETQTNSASVLQYIRVPKKAFQFEEGDIKITLAAKKMAKSIVQNATVEEQERSARNFLERYGSHYPAGVQTLGGVYFSIADVHSKKTAFADLSSKETDKHLKLQIGANFPSGVPGIRAEVSGKYTNGKRKESGNQRKDSNESSSDYVTSMGPEATDPDTFQMLLSYKSTWALIDRGSCKGYIPVWELIKKLGGSFEFVSSILKKTWEKDERIRESEKQRMREDKEVREELQSILTNHMHQKVRKHGYTGNSTPKKL